MPWPRTGVAVPAQASGRPCQLGNAGAVTYWPAPDAHVVCADAQLPVALTLFPRAFSLTTLEVPRDH
jgi:hypothetical protein